MVPSAAVLELLSKFVQSRNLKWAEVTSILGFSYPIRNLYKRKFISREIAEKVIRGIHDYNIKNPLQSKTVRKWRSL
jgi:hypothetical protein